MLEPSARWTVLVSPTAVPPPDTTAIGYSDRATTDEPTQRTFDGWASGSLTKSSYFEGSAQSEAHTLAPFLKWTRSSRRVYWPTLVGGTTGRSTVALTPALA